jgi:hypothetical protein
MDAVRRACVSRVRVLALAAMTRAGGRPSDYQLLRAVEPVLGDLLGSAAPESGSSPSASPRRPRRGRSAARL